MVVAFTGHRPNKLGGYGPSATQDRVRAKLREVLGGLRPTWGISGMALGVDQWAAEVCVEMQVPFTAAVPFNGQESRWPEDSQRRYRELLAKASDVVVVSDGGYEAWKMQRRNQWMVDNADVLVAVWDGSPGGTANCVKYARDTRGRCKSIVSFDPREL